MRGSPCWHPPGRRAGCVYWCQAGRASAWGLSCAEHGAWSGWAYSPRAEAVFARPSLRHGSFGSGQSSWSGFSPRSAAACGRGGRAAAPRVTCPLACCVIPCGQCMPWADLPVGIKGQDQRGPRYGLRLQEAARRFCSWEAPWPRWPRRTLAVRSSAIRPRPSCGGLAAAGRISGHGRPAASASTSAAGVWSTPRVEHQDV